MTMLGSFAGALVCLLVPARAGAQTSYDYRVLATAKTSTLEKEMNERRAAAAAEAETERAAQISRATEIENQVVRLSTRLEKVEAEATAKYEQAADFVTTAGETIEK